MIKKNSRLGKIILEIEEYLEQQKEEERQKKIKKEADLRKYEGNKPFNLWDLNQHLKK